MQGLGNESKYLLYLAKQVVPIHQCLPGCVWAPGTLPALCLEKTQLQTDGEGTGVSSEKNTDFSSCFYTCQFCELAALHFNLSTSENAVLLQSALRRMTINEYLLRVTD